MGRSPGPEDLVGLWRGKVQFPRTPPIKDWVIGVAITRVVRFYEERWQLGTAGAGARNASARREADRIIVEFEIPDAGMLTPHKVTLTLNSQATKLEGILFNAGGETAPEWKTLRLTLDRFAVRPWPPTPSEVLSAAEARDLEPPANVEAIGQDRVGT